MSEYKQGKVVFFSQFKSLFFSYINFNGDYGITYKVRLGYAHKNCNVLYPPPKPHPPPLHQKKTSKISQKKSKRERNNKKKDPSKKIFDTISFTLDAPESAQVKATLGSY